MASVVDRTRMTVNDAVDVVERFLARHMQLDLRRRHPAGFRSYDSLFGIDQHKIVG